MHIKHYVFVQLYLSIALCLCVNLHTMSQPYTFVAQKHNIHMRKHTQTGLMGTKAHFTQLEHTPTSLMNMYSQQHTHTHNTHWCLMRSHGVHRARGCKVLLSYSHFNKADKMEPTLKERRVLLPHVLLQATTLGNLFSPMTFPPLSTLSHHAEALVVSGHRHRFINPRFSDMNKVIAK